jgi:abortive infection bacteriophage resistance protein
MGLPLFYRGNMAEFNKKSLSAQEQLELLIKRGLIVTDKSSAIKTLQLTGYYRLSAYMRNFQTGDEHKFKPNTTFQIIVDLYNFDKRLRSICFDSIEKIEIAYRAAISNVMCKKYDSHWFYDKSAFIKEDCVQTVCDLIQNEICKKRTNNEYAETFICKYYEKYCSPNLPPFWMVIETFTIGSLNRLLHSINWQHKREIIECLGFTNDKKFMVKTNWLYALCVVRNICAHHSRLFNRTFRIKPTIHKGVAELDNNSNDKFYYIAQIIDYYLKTLDNDNSFENSLLELFNNYPAIDKIKLGFPQNWAGFIITPK